MSLKNDISILIVTHNHEDFIGNLIKCLEKFEYSNVYICDANSSDKTLEILKKSSFSKNLLSKSKLESFSRNNNDLIRKFNLSTKYYLLLNPDLFFDHDFIKSLYYKMESDSSIGIATPTIFYPNKNLQVTWKKFPSVAQVIKKRLGLFKTDDEIQSISDDIDWCLGACMLISSRLLKPNATLLDERYRLYCEDVDICFEAKQKNLKVKGVKEAYAYHHLNEMSSKKIFSKYNYWNICSIFKFALKWNYKYLIK
jgi:N-acetylglucosaminyl-diphospho-decaprenol L-rhamnosyltransferase